MLVNQVTLSGLRLAARLTSDVVLRVSLNRLAAIISEEVEPAILDQSTFGRLWRGVNRITSAYRPALTLVELLVEGSSVVLDDGITTIAVPGFLLDMNRLWQATLGRFLQEGLPSYVVMEERQLRGMLGYVAGRNPRNRPDPRPRPDFVVMQGTEVRAILDAKYMDVWDGPLSRDVLYQLALYAMANPETKTATILYPAAHSAAQEEWLDVRDPVDGTHRARVIARPVAVTRLAELVNPAGVSTAAECEAFAHALAFGDSRRLRTA